MDSIERESVTKFSIFPFLTSFLNLINIPNQGDVHLASRRLFKTFPITSTPLAKFLD